MAACEDGVDRTLGVRTRPPDQLDRHAPAVARNASRRPALLSPRPEVREPARSSEREAVAELEHLLGYQQHLNVRDLVRDPARHTPREYHLHDSRRQRIRD